MDYIKDYKQIKNLEVAKQTKTPLQVSICNEFGEVNDVVGTISPKSPKFLGDRFVLDVMGTKSSIDLSLGKLDRLLFNAFFVIEVKDAVNQKTLYKANSVAYGMFNSTSKLSRKPCNFDLMYQTGVPELLLDQIGKYISVNGCGIKKSGVLKGIYCTPQNKLMARFVIDSNKIYQCALPSSAEVTIFDLLGREQRYYYNIPKKTCQKVDAQIEQEQSP